MADIAPIVPKLAPLLRLLGSDCDGEALGAARALRRVLLGAGANFHDLAERITAPPRALPVERPAQATAKHPASDEASATAELLAKGLRKRAFNIWEMGFAQSIIEAIEADPDWEPTDRQAEVLDKLLDKANGRRR